MNRISPLKRAYLEVYFMAGRYPRLFLPLERLRRDKSIRAVRKGTEIVIEGYPRSGNTFAQIAFRLVQPRSVEIAHHLHMPAQVLWAVQHDIPAIVLIREPVDAVVSLVIGLYGEECIAMAFRNYLRVYRPLLPVRDRVVICRFQELVSDFEPVVNRVNAKWGTSFVPFEHSAANVRRCFEQIEQADLEDRSAVSLLETTVARPSTVRVPLAAELRPKVARHPLREKAEELYKRFTDPTGA
jgi:hypothetical protein